MGMVDMLRNSYLGLNLQKEKPTLKDLDDLLAHLNDRNMVLESYKREIKLNVGCVSIFEMEGWI